MSLRNLPTWRVVICLVISACIFFGHAFAETTIDGESSSSFDRTPLVNPRIIQDMSCWHSDSGNQVVAINLLDSQESNRYHGKTETRPNTITNNPHVLTQDGKSEFGYSYIGKTSAGVDVLYTSESGGGSGIFTNIMLVMLKKHDGFTFDEDSGSIKLKEELRIEKLCEIPLGDRWEGELKIEGDQLIITEYSYVLTNGRREKAQSKHSIIKIAFALKRDSH